MKSEMKLHVNEFNIINDNFKWGPIFFEVDNVFFPEKNWSDLLFVILSEWSCSIIDIMNKKHESIVLPFVDGNSAIRIELESKEKATARFGKWDQMDNSFETEFSKEIDFLSLIDKIDKVNTRIIDHVIFNNYKLNYFAGFEKWAHKLKLKL